VSARRLTTTRIEAARGVFMISVAAELAEMHPQTLRQYEDRGLITPKRSAGGTRLYSQEDVDRLRRIQSMTAELGLNLAGVERVLELEERAARMARRIDLLERRSVRLEAELEAALKQHRSEIVLYQPRSSTMVRRTSS
jgi:MerR family transcriptional regulator/heat shock protein HspR